MRLLAVSLRDFQKQPGVAVVIGEQLGTDPHSFSPASWWPVRPLAVVKPVTGHSRGPPSSP